MLYFILVFNHKKHNNNEESIIFHLHYLVSDILF